MAINSSKGSPNFLIPGTKYLADHPDFKMIGRENDLNAATDVLMKKGPNNNLVLYGPSGVGLSSIVMGLQSVQNGHSTPIDIAKKSFFYLNVDALFSCPDTAAVNAGFRAAMDTLKSTPNAVLIIEDAKGFLDGAKSNNAANMINALMLETRNNPDFQTIFVASDNDLPQLTESHSDISKIFTMQAVGEPSPEDIKNILKESAAQMGKLYGGIAVSDDAINSVLELTAKYPGIRGRLGAMQPKCSVMLLEGAMVDYCRTVQQEAHPPGVSDKKWDEQQTQIRSLQEQIATCLAQIDGLNSSIELAKEKAKAKREAIEQCQAAAGDQAAIDQIKKNFQLDYFEPLVLPKESNTEKFNGLTGVIAKGGFATGETKGFEDAKKPFDKLLKEHREALAELTKDNPVTDAGLTLTDDHVLGEFSRVSNLDVSKLKQDDRDKLLGMEEELESGIFGQPQAIKAVVKAVQRGTIFRLKKDKPKGSFFFIGPSGVGKTELAKKLATFLYGDEDALNTYNMPEFSKDNDVTKLLGPPPGYQGFDAGGILTNNLFKRPACVNLFDEIEKAHPDIFDPLMRFIDEGKIQDNHGRVATGADTINIFTSNIGSQYFLEADDTPEGYAEAVRKAKKDLIRHTDPETGKEIGLRPEFLNRFGEDNIIFFNRLDNSVVELIAEKYLKDVNEQASAHGISVEMSKEDIKKMVADKYKPSLGARAIQLYIDGTIASDVAETFLRSPDKEGTMKISYIPAPKADEETIAAIRKELSTGLEAQVTIRKEVNAEFAPQLTAQYSLSEPDEAKRKILITEKLEEKVWQRVEEKVKERVKDLEKASGKISTSFIPKGAAASVPKAAANSNTRKRAKKPAIA